MRPFDPLEHRQHGIFWPRVYLRGLASSASCGAASIPVLESSRELTLGHHRASLDDASPFWRAETIETECGSFVSGFLRDAPSGDGRNEIQLVAEIGTVTAGTFTLSFSGTATGPIPFNAAASTIQLELETIPEIGTGNVQVTGGPLPATISVEFREELGNQNISTMGVSSSGLTGGTYRVSTSRTGREPLSLRGPVLWIGNKDFPESTPSIYFDVSETYSVLKVLVTRNLLKLNQLIDLGSGATFDCDQVSSGIVTQLQAAFPSAIDVIEGPECQYDYYDYGAKATWWKRIFYVIRPIGQTSGIDGEAGAGLSPYADDRFAAAEISSVAGSTSMLSSLSAISLDVSYADFQKSSNISGDFAGVVFWESAFLLTKRTEPDQDSWELNGIDFEDAFVVVDRATDIPSLALCSQDLGDCAVQDRAHLMISAGGLPASESQVLLRVSNIKTTDDGIVVVSRSDETFSPFVNSPCCGIQAFPAEDSSDPSDYVRMTWSGSRLVVLVFYDFGSGVQRRCHVKTFVSDEVRHFFHHTEDIRSVTFEKIGDERWSKEFGYWKLEETVLGGLSEDPLLEWDVPTYVLGLPVFHSIPNRCFWNCSSHGVGFSIAVCVMDGLDVDISGLQDEIDRLFEADTPPPDVVGEFGPLVDGGGNSQDASSRRIYRLYGASYANASFNFPLSLHQGLDSFFHGDQTYYADDDVTPEFSDLMEGWNSSLPLLDRFGLGRCNRTNKSVAFFVPTVSVDGTDYGVPQNPDNFGIGGNTTDGSPSGAFAAMKNFVSPILREGVNATEDECGTYKLFDGAAEYDIRWFNQINPIVTQRHANDGTGQYGPVAGRPEDIPDGFIPCPNTHRLALSEFLPIENHTLGGYSAWADEELVVGLPSPVYGFPDGYVTGDQQYDRISGNFLRAICGELFSTNTVVVSGAFSPTQSIVFSDRWSRTRRSPGPSPIAGDLQAYTKAVMYTPNYTISSAICSDGYVRAFVPIWETFIVSDGRMYGYADPDNLPISGTGNVFLMEPDSIWASNRSWAYSYRVAVFRSESVFSPCDITEAFHEDMIFESSTLISQGNGIQENFPTILAGPFMLSPRRTPLVPVVPKFINENQLRLTMTVSLNGNSPFGNNRSPIEKNPMPDEVADLFPARMKIGSIELDNGTCSSCDWFDEEIILDRFFSVWDSNEKPPGVVIVWEKNGWPCGPTGAPSLRLELTKSPRFFVLDSDRRVIAIYGHINGMSRNAANWNPNDVTDFYKIWASEEECSGWPTTLTISPVLTTS